ncbi:ABC transporter ATP-binding protein [Natronoglycomyces albus]|uniref:ABC transporter ATP-binding protein n=1 Tax=Natronoglycomyces albus TaxID=2811108 RepID=A0A895XEM2_9ACTN|nr:ABC transporter ATP-binding protein [Natronoglycomyces albus]QSB04281.1 ABC transporter ATP-binding protein [Natronoglycomyces albus]
MTPVIEISGLRKTYRSLFGKTHHAVDGLDMSVEPNQVHGFLGPNGSGKTTTLRSLLGLVSVQGGTMRVFDRPVPDRLAEVVPLVGAVVEAPRFFEKFSAFTTLQLLATSVGMPTQRVHEVLEQVGLTHYANFRVGSFSLGMKQRLAVAQALIKRPRLLILDEPANGLDPAGIHQMRTLLRTLAKDFDTTVLVSSHVLSEVQQLCDTVTIISHGRRIQAGSVKDLMSAAASNELSVSVAPEEITAALEALHAHEGVVAAHVDGQLTVTGAPDPSWVTKTLADHDIYLSGLSRRSINLEEVYLKLTAQGGLEDVHEGGQE